MVSKDTHGFTETHSLWLLVIATYFKSCTLLGCPERVRQLVQTSAGLTWSPFPFLIHFQIPDATLDQSNLTVQKVPLKEPKLVSSQLVLSGSLFINSLNNFFSHFLFLFPKQIRILLLYIIVLLLLYIIFYINNHSKLISPAIRFY